MNEETNFGPNTFNAMTVHENMLELHTCALACHCECLGMNAENSFAICLGKNIPYDNDSYIIAMRKWGLIDEEGNPTI